VHLGGEEPVNLVETKNLARRSIEQLGFIKDINSLVVLSGTSRLIVPYHLPEIIRRVSPDIISTTDAGSAHPSRQS